MRVALCALALAIALLAPAVRGQLSQPLAHDGQLEGTANKFQQREAEDDQPDAR